MARCLTVGGVTQDIILQPHQLTTSHLWQAGAKIELDSIAYTIGGGAANSAVSLVNLGHTTELVCVLGNDTAGKNSLQELKERSVTVHAIFDNNEPTGTSFVIPTANHDRVIFSHHGANNHLSQSMFSNIPFHLYNCIYIAPLHDKALSILPHITASIKNNETSPSLIAVNPSTEQLRNSTAFKASLHFIDVLIINSEEMMQCAAHLYSKHSLSKGKGLIIQGPDLAKKILSYESTTFTLYELCKELFSYGIKRIVITDGNKGAYVATKDTLYFHSALTVPLVNTLGAGDAFGSAFVSAMIDGKKTEDALRYGIINASCVIQHNGAQEGLLTKKQMEKQIALIPQHLLQSYTWPY